MIGPVKIQHQLSNDALGRIQAWAHHMWTTIQQQKERIVQLQTQLRRLQNQAVEPRALPAGSEAEPSKVLPTAAFDTPQLPTTTSVSPEMWQWVLTRLEQTEQGQEQLKAQIAQLQGQATPLMAQSVVTALQDSGAKPEMQTELIKWREESRALQYQQSEQWRTIFEHFRYNTQQALAEYEPKLQDLLEPLKTQLVSQTQAIAHLEGRLESELQGRAAQTDAALQDLLTPIQGQIEVQAQAITQLEDWLTGQAAGQLERQLHSQIHRWQSSQEEYLGQLAQQLESLQQSQGTWATEQEQKLSGWLDPLKGQIEAQQQTLMALETQLQTQLQASQSQTIEQLSTRMQAAQVQADEALQGAIDPLKSQVEAQEQVITELADRLQATQSQAIAQVTTQIQATQTQAEAALQGAVEPLQAQLQELQRAQDEQKQQVEQHLESFRQTQADESVRQAQHLSEAMTPLKGQIEAQQQTLVALETQLQTAQVAMSEALQTQIQAVQTDAKADLNRAIAPLTAQLQGLQSAHSEISEQLAVFQTTQADRVAEQEQQFQQIQQVLAAHSQALPDAVAPLEQQLESQKQAIADLEHCLQTSQTQALEQLSSQIQDKQTQALEATLQRLIVPLAAQLQHLKTTQHDLNALPQQVRSLQGRVEQQQVDTTLLEQESATLTNQVQTLSQNQAQQARSMHQLTEHTAQLQQNQDQATQEISPTEIRETLVSLQAQIQELRTVQLPMQELPQDLKQLELTIQQYTQATEPASLAWQRQKNEILAKIDRFDTICEQFQALESTVTQLQKAIHLLTPPSTVAARHTNTVYTRYQ